MSVLNILLGILVLGMIVFGIVYLKDYYKAKANKTLEPKEKMTGFAVTGFVVNFFDTLGIGGFAPMTAIFKQFKLVSDKMIPGTLNAVMCIPVMLEAILFIKDVKVDSLTLVSMLLAAAVGAGIGASVVSRFNERKIQLTMASALFLVFVIMLIGNLGLMPIGGDATGLRGTKLIIAVVGNLILGSLMTVGVGLYAPCMAMVYTLGMSPLAAFPIMMGSCAYLMPVASMKFIKAGVYHRRATGIMTITGCLGVFIAAYLVQSMPIYILQWVVLVVVAYTSFKLYRDAHLYKKNHLQAPI